MFTHKYFKQFYKHDFINYQPLKAKLYYYGNVLSLPLMVGFCDKYTIRVYCPVLVVLTKVLVWVTNGI